MKYFEISLVSQWNSTVIVTLARFEGNPKMYVNVQRYLLQVYVLQILSNYFDSKLSYINKQPVILILYIWDNYVFILYQFFAKFMFAVTEFYIYSQLVFKFYQYNDGSWVSL